MLPFKSPSIIFSTLSPIFSILVVVVSLYQETVDLVGDELPNSTLPAVISDHGIKEIQVAQFLKNLEVSFFTGGSTNITK